MNVDTERRIDRFFWALIAFAVLYTVLQIGRTFAAGDSLAPSGVPQPTSTTFPVQIVHMPSTDEIRIEHRP